MPLEPARGASKSHAFSLKVEPRSAVKLKTCRNSPVAEDGATAPPSQTPNA